MSPQPGQREPAEPSRPDASMSLLTAVMEHSLDEGYEEAAARRRAEGRAGLPRTVRAKLWLAAGLVLTATVVTLGAAQTHVTAPAVAKERAELLDRIETGTAETERLQAEVDALRETVAEQQRAALRREGSARADLIALLAGDTAVRGTGLQLVVDDAVGTGHGLGDGPRDSPGFSDSGRVRDRDLQRVVNGLWAAGAEALSVNGQRLTALSAVRAAGDAILVDNRPLAPPYTVLAVGDGAALREAFENGRNGHDLAVLRDHYGIRVSTSVEEEVHLPAAPSLVVRTAEPMETGEGNTS
ncbi:DUF881 domain-containing protein [Streptomyces sp. ACA25]|nr:DUF881 domain-containing protein [Streptomyces sp. ACA25]MDB1089380.1 DUF881 domain-containing protein [Streptomyces sp. ACA25]